MFLLPLTIPPPQYPPRSPIWSRSLEDQMASPIRVILNILFLFRNQILRRLPRPIFTAFFRQNCEDSSLPKRFNFNTRAVYRCIILENFLCRDDLGKTFHLMHREDLCYSNLNKDITNMYSMYTVKMKKK